jgi:prephenate dehydrogenase
MVEQPCIAIVGTGLVGTSLGMAILSAKGKEVQVIGHDIEFAQARLSQRMGGVSSVERNLISACARADMVILATPVTEIRETLQLIADDLKPGCVVTDTADVKTPVLAWADELLPENVSFIGGNPILGGDEAGIESARADLFQGARYCITPSTRASPEGIKLVNDMLSRIGADSHTIDPQEHDRLIGGTEHLADILAATFLGTLSGSNGWRDMRRMGGATFDRVTCFSQEDPAEYRGRALYNRANVLRWIDAYQQELFEFRQLIAQGDSTGIERYYGAHMERRDDGTETVHHDRGNGSGGDIAGDGDPIR